MSEYYAGGSNVPSGTTANPNGTIPSSGALQMDDFGLTSVLQSFMSASGQVLQQVATLIYTQDHWKWNFSSTTTGQNFFCWKN